MLVKGGKMEWTWRKKDETNLNIVWYKWFAWFPVCVDKNKKTNVNHIVWLQYVERTDRFNNYDGWYHQYRKLLDKKEEKHE